MSIPKPKNLYIEEEVPEISFADKLKLAQKMIKESKEPTPIESIKEQAEEIKPTPPSPRPFSYEKPPGWNKRKRRTPFIIVFWKGITRRMDMDIKDHKRYDRFIDTIFPGFLITITGLVMIGGYIFFTKKDNNDYNGNSFIDKSINWIINMFDKSTNYDDGAKENTLQTKTPIPVVDTTVQYVDTVIAVPKLSTDNIKLPKTKDTVVNFIDKIFEQPKSTPPPTDTVVKVVTKPTPKLIIPKIPVDEDNTKLNLSRYIRTIPQFVDNFGGDDWSRLTQDEDNEYKWTLSRANGTVFHFIFDTTTQSFKMR